MDEKNRPEYIDICIGYRVVTLILSGMTYVAMSLYYGSTALSWVILLGMLVSCLLSSWLYRRIGESERWLRVMFAIETFAYGIFTVLSGGLSSPYLWYQMSCILLMITLERHPMIPAIASLWCLFCAFAGRIDKGIAYQELNVILGMLIVIGGFYVLRRYIRYIERQKKLLIGLNRNLEKEKERSEYAFLQLAGLYESFHLFAMTDPEKIIQELSQLLQRAIAPSGCILIKFDNGGSPERKEVCGIEKELAKKMVEELKTVEEELRKKNERPSTIILRSGGGDHEAKLIGDPITSGGALIRKRSDKGQENEDFYRSLIEIVFRNLDTHSQMERFITMEEQNRIANEIHDTVIQKLFGVVCSLKVLDDRFSTLSEEDVRQHIDMLKRSVELTMTELRESIYGRSFKNTINTLVGAMTLYMEEVQLLSGVSIVMDIDDGTDYLTAAQKIAVYRISCEAVNNAIRHGGARNVKVDLKIDAEQVELQIQDDGRGSVESKGSFYEGNGLKNMRHIAALLKGSLSMDSEPSKGMRIKLTLPR
ncbi:MAG: histidine kinase [Peptostreptococcaceae bacterium]|nr:histidine kinase [Peptostreptococcaceae bacterium]